MRRRRISGLWLALLLLQAAPVAAQIVLPGAAQPEPAGTVATPDAQKPKPAIPRPPADATITDRELRLRGAIGGMLIARSGKSLAVSRLVLTGQVSSRPADRCRVEVAGPLALTPAPRHNGLLHFDMELAICPIGLDVLDGAVLATSPAGVCTFQEADCQVDPRGMWGPAGASLGPEQARAIERARAGSEKRMREAFKALLASTKDRARIRQWSAEQAGFSSAREETCRDYAQEDVHGFCAERLTEARVIELENALHPVSDAPDKKPVRKKAQPKPPLVPGPAPSTNPLAPAIR